MAGRHGATAKALGNPQLAITRTHVTVIRSHLTRCRCSSTTRLAAPLAVTADTLDHLRIAGLGLSGIYLKEYFHYIHIYVAQGMMIAVALVGVILLQRSEGGALGIGVGSGYLFPTTFESEVYSDLTGERGILMGALAGVMEAQYDVLRKNGHSPSEAFNETVEELTQSLIRLVAENGMDWMYANCSATAQRGALDWKPKFKEAVEPVFKDLYERVASGAETQRVLDSTGGPNYKELLGKELAEIKDSEMWRAGQATRDLRPKEEAKTITDATKGVAGRQSN